MSTRHVLLREFLHDLLARRVSRATLGFLDSSAREVADLADPRGLRFPTLISLCSRHVPRGPLTPDADELGRANTLLEGWNPERWSSLDAARAWLVLSRSDVSGPGVILALEECFAYADVGELVALYRTLALLPGPERFAWRSGEGCRSSMRVVYEAAACDTPLPFHVFDDLAWRQLVIKALFVGAPLWRVHGLDQRLDAELARMALDLCEERRSAGRPIPPELWACLGRFGGERGRAALEAELAGNDSRSRRGAAIALARAGLVARLAELERSERDPAVRDTMKRAAEGHATQTAYRELEPV